MSARQRLTDLDGEITKAEKEISELRKRHDDAVADDDADCIYALCDQIEELEKDITRLRARRPVVGKLVDDEDKAAKRAQAAVHAKQADAMRNEIVRTVAECLRLARELKAATDALSERAALNWSIEARKAIEGGAAVDRLEPEGMAELLNLLHAAKNRIGHVVADFAQRSVSIVPRPVPVPRVRKVG